MTDTELPPCGICESEPCGFGRKKEYVYCNNPDCFLDGLYKKEQWRQLHTPAQVLREVVDLIMEGSHNWHILYNSAARYKAQQLSGREP